MSFQPSSSSHSRYRPLLPPILPIEPDQPLRWLVLGFRDLTRNPWLSLAHGAVMAVAGLAFTWLAHDRFWLLAGLVSAVLAPVLATSLYATSRAIERGERVNVDLLVSTWTRWNLKLQTQPDSYWALIRFGLLLGLAALGWVFTSSAFIALMAPVPIHAPMAFWAFLLMGFSLLGIFSLFLGLILVVPVLGHASWHAYRETVDVSGLPVRLDKEKSPA